MSSETLNLTPKLYAYLQSVSLREPSILVSLRKETAQLPGSVMQISPEQGQFMGLLMELIFAKRTLDIGTFTGYSALVVALHLPPDGKVIACELDPKIAEVAKRFWQEAGVASKIELKLGAANDSLDQLLAAGEAGSFDFAFIDADKRNYDSYYEKSLSLLKKGGLIAIDNVLWEGAVVEENNNDETTEMFRRLNNKLLKDERVSISMLPIGDGLTLARKR